MSEQQGQYKVYQFTVGDGDRGYIFIGAKTWKQARGFAVTSWLGEYAENFIDYKGNLAKGRKTSHLGVLNLKQTQEADMLWFECGECGSDNLLIEDGEYVEKYTCNDCGHVGSVPYVD